SVVDPDGRIQTYAYDGGGKLATITDVASGRKLHLTWTGGHVTRVATDPPVTGATAPAWTYGYDGDRLTQVCTPLSAQSCTGYAYTGSSHYRSVVTDDNPAGYWPLGEPTDTADAVNVVATKAGERQGSYEGVTSGVPGALAGSPDTAADFGASPTSAVTLPKNLADTSIGLAVELWFKAAAGENGVLFGMQNDDLTSLASATQWTPVLYVGTDGRLHGRTWTEPASTQMLSPGRVDDGAWHHVVLSGAGDAQQLYLDGGSVGTPITGRLIDHRDMVYAQFGNGRGSAGWPATVVGAFPFTGHIDEAAYYRHPLGPTQVAAHWAARNPTVRLTTVTEPLDTAGQGTALQLGYDGPSGRVATITDRHGASWDLGAPTPDDGDRVVVLAPDNAEPVTYRHDTTHGGRLKSRTDTFGEQAWTYNARGFVSKHTDANGNAVSYDTDKRGNVLGQTTCRTASQCLTSYSGYYLNAADPLDPRNDVRIWAADARSASATDTTYRTTYTIDTTGRVTAVTYVPPSGQATAPTETFAYSTGTEAAEPAGTGPVPPGLLLSTTGRNGKTSHHYYNTAGDLVRTVDPVGLTVRNAHDALGRATSTTTGTAADDDAYGTTSYAYNAASLPTSVTAPSITNPVSGQAHRATTVHEYNAAGQPTRTTVHDTGGAGAGADTMRVWTRTYDALGRLDTIRTPDMFTTDLDWDSRGDLVARRLPHGMLLQHAYDEGHRLIETVATGVDVDPMNPNAGSLVMESRAYDPAGRLASVVDAMGRETGYTYYGDNLPAGTARLRRNADGDVTSQTMLTELDYNAAGQVNRRTTAGGVTATFVYDKAGHVKEEHLDPAGLDRATVYTRNLDGSVATATRTGAASPGRSEATGYTYDDAGRVLTETVANTGGAPAALTTTYQRDSRGLVTQVTDPAGTETRFTHDIAGNPSTATGEARTVWTGGTSSSAEPVATVGYNTFGEATHQRDPNGFVTTTTMDAGGRPTAITLPTYTPPGGVAIIATQRLSYNTQGLVERVTDPLGRVTSHAYDGHGNLVSRTLPDPDGDGPKPAPVWRYGYDRVGAPLSTTDPTGGATSATYNDLGHQVTATVTDRANGTTAYLTTTLGRDDAGNLTTVTTPLGHATTASYNKAGEPLRVTDPTDRFTQTGYDLAGRPATTVKGKGSSYVDPVTTYTYDLAGRRTAVADCTATTTGGCGTVLRTATTAYDGAGRPTTATTPEGRLTQYGYDPAGQLTSITQRRNPTDPATAVTVQLGYDPAGRRTRMVDGNTNPTTYTYTPWGQTASVIEPATTTHPDPADRTWTTGYDAAGQPVAYLLPGGVTRTLTYDRLGNLTGETGTGTGATAARQLDYDALGRTTSVGGPGGATTYAWNDRGQLLSTTGAAGAAAYTYDSDGNLTTRTDPAGTATFTYNAAGMPATVADPLTGVTASYTYKNSGQVGQITYGTGGPTRTYTYDNLARPATDVLKKPNGTTTASVTYGYDRDDQLTTRTTAGIAGAGTHTYAYDGLNRLTAWTKPGNIQTTYGYDGASNRTTVTDPTGTRTTTYDARNRASAANGAGQAAETWTWTPRGTLAGRTLGTATDSYTFDAFERLTTASKPGSTV
ncbi:LamG-like jellyroll fold domain-containing protein, partial [Actinophytocola sp.]|uniref:LamG-like jellyroll fold domain-containing protein n=1 Tax=Actinophytocola sp. TaxID=1872138 RepID=UPI002D808EA6